MGCTYNVDVAYDEIEWSYSGCKRQRRLRREEGLGLVSVSVLGKQLEGRRQGDCNDICL